MYMPLELDDRKFQSAGGQRGIELRSHRLSLLITTQDAFNTANRISTKEACAIRNW